MLKYKIPQIVTLTRAYTQQSMFLLKQIKKGTTTVVPFLSTPSGIRTLDPLIKSQLLYQLS